MVWEKNSKAIVMTTGLTEGGRVKCEQYWPDDVDEPPMQVGALTVAVTAPAVRSGQHLFTQLELTYTDPDGHATDSREIGHFWYDTWPDHGAPEETASVCAMLEAVKEYSEGGPAEPWLVHCSAGIGRTGTFIGIDMGMQLLSTSGLVSVKALIESMRQDRGGTVQTAVQAAFIQNALEAYAQSLNSPGLATFEVQAPLGIKFNGSATQGFVVSCLTDDGNARGAGIALGMRLFSVDDVPVDGLAKPELTDHLQELASSSGPARLVFFPPSTTVLALDVAMPLGFEFDGDAEGGYVVTSVESGGNADIVGIVPGTRLLRVNQLSVDGLGKDDLLAGIEASSGAMLLTLESAARPATFDAGDGDATAGGESDYPGAALSAEDYIADDDSADGSDDDDGAGDDNDYDGASSHGAATHPAAAAEAEAALGVVGWLHTNRSDGEAVKLMQEAGMRDGIFLVRQVRVRGDAGADEVAHVLDLATHGLVTHHVITDDPASGLLVNGEELCDGAAMRTLPELIDWMCERQANWAQKLVAYVPANRSPGDRVVPLSVPVQRLKKESDGPSTFMPTSPAQKASTQNALKEAVRVLSAYRQQKMYEILGMYVNKRWPLSSLVAGMGTVLGKLEPEDRRTIQGCIGNLIPPTARRDYATLIDRVQTENALAEVLGRVAGEEQTKITEFVVAGRRALQRDDRAVSDIADFEWRVNKASAMRGWAACEVQATDAVQTTTIDVEVVAKHVHIGWARAMVNEWDTTAYGLPPIGQVQLNREGLLDSDNFESAQGYRCYRDRVVLAQQRYTLPREAPDEGVVVLGDAQKHSYRVSAELIVNAYLSRNPGVAYMRKVVRVDSFVPSELAQLGIIQPPPDRQKVRQLSTFQKSILFGSVGRKSSLTGKKTGLLTPRIALPAAAAAGVPTAYQETTETTMVMLTLPLGINFNIIDSHVVVTHVLNTGSAHASGELNNSPIAKVAF